MSKLEKPILVGMILFLVPILTYAETYKVTVTRVADNIYKIDENQNIFIQTTLCLELAVSEEAIIKYEKLSLENQIFFISSRETCDVKKIYFIKTLGD